MDKGARYHLNLDIIDFCEYVRDTYKVDVVVVTDDDDTLTTLGSDPAKNSEFFKALTEAVVAVLNEKNHNDIKMN